MSAYIVAKGELYEILKKRKLSTIEESGETDQEDSRGIEENVDELIIENEAEKFIELFEKKNFQKRQKKLNLILKMVQYKI